MKIGDYELGYGHRPMIIAEIAASHNGSLETALKLLELSKQAGADGVKIQCFLPSTITLDSDRDEFIIKDGPWKGKRLYDLYTQAHMPRAWFQNLFAAALQLDIPLFASVFSPEDLDFIKRFEPPAYKIASCELVDSGLIKAVADVGKPIILSTGMASRTEIDAAAEDVFVGGKRFYTPNPHNAIFLHCIAEYPAKVEWSSMSWLRSMQAQFSNIGLSDHSRSAIPAIIATAMGAVMIEKHITLTPGDTGLDDGFAISPSQFAKFCDAIHEAYSAMGVSSEPRRADVTHLPLRRSLYVVENVRAGAMFNTFNVRSIRPGAGMDPRKLATVIGARAKVDIAAGTPLKANLINNGDAE